MEENPILRKKAVALSYDDADDPSPKIEALGKGYIAEKIIETAIKNNVPIYEDENIVNVLLKLEVGELIPPQLYTAIAEIIVFTMELEASSSQDNKK